MASCSTGTNSSFSLRASRSTEGAPTKTAGFLVPDPMSRGSSNRVEAWEVIGVRGRNRGGMTACGFSDVWLPVLGRRVVLETVVKAL